MTSVLIVEDDEDTRTSLAALIERRGFGVATAAKGEDALEALKADGSPQLIILDLMLPGMSGWQVRVECLSQAELALTPVVLLSALNDVEQHAKILGAVDYLRKPIDLDKLYDLLDAYCS